MPISGAIKVDTSRVSLSPIAVGTGGLLLLAVALSTGAAAFLRHPATPLRTWWAVCMAGALAASMWYACFAAIQWTGGGWYHVPQLLAAALGTAGAVDRAIARLPAGRRRPLVVSGAVATALVIAAAEGSFFLRASYRAEIADVVAFGGTVARSVPEGQVVAVADYPGVVALTSGRAVVAFDGLTGDYRYQERLRDLGASCTFDHLGVGYLVTRIPEPARRDARGAYLVAAGSSIYDAGWSDLRVSPDDELATAAPGPLRLFRYRSACG